MAAVLTVEEVAADLRCGTSSVYVLIREGKLRAFRIGKRGVRVTVDALEQFKSGSDLAERAS